VASVAKRYRISAAQVASWNQVGATAHFMAGQVIVVYVPVGKPAARTVAAARKPASIKHPQRTTAKVPVRVAKN
jgi:membrane-bound lytic murein transglycosylase D